MSHLTGRCARCGADTNFDLCSNCEADAASHAGPETIVVFNNIDNVSATPETYDTIAKAKAFRTKLIERYRAQGYYSSPTKGRIPFGVLEKCQDAMFPIRVI